MNAVSFNNVDKWFGEFQALSAINLEVLQGEIVISLDTARRQAEALHHGELRELSELVLHGVLHLVGYDHERDHGEMNELEVALREELLS